MRFPATALLFALVLPPAAAVARQPAPSPGLERDRDWGMIAGSDAPPSIVFLDRASVRRNGGSVDFDNLYVFRDVQPPGDGSPAFDRMRQTVRADCATLRYDVLMEATQLGRVVSPPTILMLTPGGIEAAPGSVVRREIEAICSHALSGDRIASPDVYARDYFRTHPAAPAAQR